jgi:F-box protein 11
VEPSDKPELTNFDNWCDTFLDAAAETQLEPEATPTPTPAIRRVPPVRPAASPPAGPLPQAIPVHPILEVVSSPAPRLVQDSPPHAGKRLFLVGVGLALVLTVAGVGGGWFFLINSNGKPKGGASAEDGRPTLHVSPAGEGTFRTIGEAIRQAKAGSRIRVGPGTYHESLLLDREVEIIGDGLPGQVAVESSQAECVLMMTARAAVRKLVLRGRAGQEHKLYHTVKITEGKLTLEDCDITCDSLACVAIHGSGTDPVLRRCQIYGGAQSGVLIQGNGRGLLEDCDIYGNAEHNVKVTDGAQPVLRGCKIHDGNQAGVAFQSFSRGRIENCSIYDNAHSNVIIQDESAAVLRHCTLQGGKQSGVYLLRKSQGTLDDCDVSGSLLPGVVAQDGSSPLLHKCRIHDCKDAGVYLLKGATGTVEDCDILANKYGVALSDAANPVIQQCRIQRNLVYGIYAFTRGTATVRNCDLTGNLSMAAHIDAAATVSRVNNRE